MSCRNRPTVQSSCIHVIPQPPTSHLLSPPTNQRPHTVPHRHLRSPVGLIASIPEVRPLCCFLPSSFSHFIFSSSLSLLFDGLIWFLFFLVSSILEKIDIETSLCSIERLSQCHLGLFPLPGNSSSVPLSWFHFTLPTSLVSDCTLIESCRNRTDSPSIMPRASSRICPSMAPPSAPSWPS